MKSFANFAIDTFFRFLVWTALKLPYERRLKVFGYVFKVVIGPLSGYAKRSGKNLRLIFPDMPDEEVRQISRSISANFGKNLIENYSKDDLVKRLENAQIGGPGLEHLHTAVAQGKPVLLLSGHIGNYEVVRLALYNMGYQSAGFYRPASNVRFNEHYVKTLEYLSGPAFPQTRRGILGFVRHLKSGGMAAMLFDVRDKTYDTIDFLGQPAHTSTFPAEIALKTGAVVIPCFAHRCEDGITHAVSFEEPITSSSPKEIMTEASDRLAAQILRFPDQWLWVHNRWALKRDLIQEAKHDE